MYEDLPDDDLDLDLDKDFDLDLLLLMERDLDLEFWEVESLGSVKCLKLSSSSISTTS